MPKETFSLLKVGDDGFLRNLVYSENKVFANFRLTIETDGEAVITIFSCTADWTECVASDKNELFLNAFCRSVVSILFCKELYFQEGFGDLALSTAM